MLDSGMKESQTKEVHLEGKKKEEFLTFMEVIEPFSKARVTTRTAKFLSCWADEYVVEALKEACEAKLTRQPVTVEALQHALDCNLSRRAEQCYEAMVKDYDE
eukprot:5734712-Amphidinium_carterae.1